MGSWGEHISSSIERNEHKLCAQNTTCAFLERMVRGENRREKVGHGFGITSSTKQQPAIHGVLKVGSLLRTSTTVLSWIHEFCLWRDRHHHRKRTVPRLL